MCVRERERVTVQWGFKSGNLTPVRSDFGKVTVKSTKKIIPPPGTVEHVSKRIQRRDTLSSFPQRFF